MCNRQLLLQFSMDHFETMHTCCGYIEDVHVNFCRGKIIVDKIMAFWTETIFRLGFNLDLDNFQVRLSVRLSVRHTLRYRVCVINSSHSFLWIFLKPCISVVDILKMCMWVFGGARINFDRITAFRT